MICLKNYSGILIPANKYPILALKCKNKLIWLWNVIVNNNILFLAHQKILYFVIDSLYS